MPTSLALTSGKGPALRLPRPVGKASNLPSSLREIWLSAPEKGRVARSSEVPREEPLSQDLFEASSWTEWLGFPRICPSPRKKRLLHSMNDATGPRPGSETQASESGPGQQNEGRNSRKGRGLSVALGGGAKVSGSAVVGCVLAQHARRGWGWRPAAGGRLRLGAWSPPAPWPRPWRISTTPMWATSTTVGLRVVRAERFCGKGCNSRGRD